jgi:predicted MPP superfamily phosphohydrolase
VTGRGLGGAIAGLAAAAAGWGIFEAGWLRTQVLDLPIQGLPPALDGVRIAHLSDFHLGVPSRGRAATRLAVDWVAERRPDLVCVTGDLLSSRRGEAELHRHLERLGHPYVVLGNHDVDAARDPFSRAHALPSVPYGELLLDRSVEVELRGARVELAGVDPRTWVARERSPFPEPQADLRILLCHFPRALDFVRTGRWHLILAGHLHAGQIVLPYGRGRLLLAHPSARYARGLFESKGTVMHVSAGTGTTFVPFRFFARPEATELVLRLP